MDNLILIPVVKMINQHQNIHIISTTWWSRWNIAAPKSSSAKEPLTFPPNRMSRWSFGVGGNLTTKRFKQCLLDQRPPLQGHAMLKAWTGTEGVMWKINPGAVKAGACVHILRLQGARVCCQGGGCAHGGERGREVLVPGIWLKFQIR